MSTEHALYGVDLFGEPIVPPSRGKIADDFLIPPFSVLNAREGWWQERKRAWLAYGIQSEMGRETHGNNAIGGWRHREKEQAESTKKMMAAGLGVVFDPVLCELCYRWFCPPGGLVLDPFTGGSVRGIVATMLGRQYWGCDLRQEQIDANREQGAAICPNAAPFWACGDALDAVPHAPMADFVFSCPPYGDLERYSDDARDLSTMEYHTFIAAMKRIILRCWQRLTPDRFAAFVVGEFRDKKGHYRNFVGDTIEAFRAVGFEYYNEAILVTAVGSLSLRINRQFKAGRKLGKTHQNLLVFVKGNARAATQACTEGEAG